MATPFTVFSNRNREAETVHKSGHVQIPAGTTRVQFSIAGLDVDDEPPTTVIYWQIELADAPGGPWEHHVGGDVQGRDGVPSRKPGYTMQTNVLPEQIGKYVRGSINFVTAGGINLKFGVDGLAS